MAILILSPFYLKHINAAQQHLFQPGTVTELIFRTLQYPAPHDTNLKVLPGFSQERRRRVFYGYTNFISLHKILIGFEIQSFLTEIVHRTPIEKIRWTCIVKNSRIAFEPFVFSTLKTYMHFVALLLRPVKLIPQLTTNATNMLFPKLQRDYNLNAVLCITGFR